MLEPLRYEPLYLDALEIYRNNYAATDFRVVVAVNDLASMYAEIGETTKAVGIYQDMILTILDTTDTEEIGMARLLNDLARLYKQQIELHREHAPDKDWRGEINFQSK